MDWFKHKADARNNPKLFAIERSLGEKGYCRAFKILEIVAQRGGSGVNFKPELDLNGPPADLDWLAHELGIPAKEVRRTLDIFAAVRFIAPEAWENGVLAIPAMLELRDEWASRKAKPRVTLPRNTGDAPEQHGSDSVKSYRSESQSQSHREREADEDSRRGRSFDLSIRTAS